MCISEVMVASDKPGGQIMPNKKFFTYTSEECNAKAEKFEAAADYYDSNCNPLAAAMYKAWSEHLLVCARNIAKFENPAEA
jgi:hypothetical protein